MFFHTKAKVCKTPGRLSALQICETFVDGVLNLFRIFEFRVIFAVIIVAGPDFHLSLIYFWGPGVKKRFEFDENCNFKKRFVRHIRLHFESVYF